MSVLILYYHSVHANSDRRVDSSIVVSPANFEWQLGHVAASRRILSLEQYVDGLLGKGPSLRMA